MITLAMLAALRQEEELAMHVKAAVRNGLTAEQIQEVLLQVAGLCGGSGRQPGVRGRRAGLGGPS